MNFAELATKLRDTSADFGGIPDYDAAARALDVALTHFFHDQDDTALRELNGAYARCARMAKQVTTLSRKGSEI